MEEFIYTTEYPSDDVMKRICNLADYDILICHPYLDPCLFMNSCCYRESHQADREEYLCLAEGRKILENLLEKYHAENSEIQRRFYIDMMYEYVKNYQGKNATFVKQWLEYHLEN